MGEDEEATLRTLSSHRKLIDSLIEEHHGRFVNSAGDSVLAEFASVVNAVQCAVEMQTTLKAENANLPPERRMEFRIGVNLGDVMVDGEQIYGDGVNVAARLESLANPGGISISGTVHEQVRDKLALRYEDLGEQEVKNIARPVRVWRVLTEPARGERLSTSTQRVPRKYVRGGIFSLAGLAILAAVIVFVHHISLRAPTTTASIPPAQKPALPLPNIPSIAVLPFTNMSGDPQQEYFSDGLTDDLTTALSRIPDLFVIARTSAFTYKGRAAKVQDIGRELGVQYLLEGSVRKAGDTLRITAQLVDASSGDHLWAAHYYLRCVGYGFRYTEEDNAKGGRMCEKAIELDPAYADAYVQLGFHYLLGFAWQWSQYGGPDALDRAIRLEQQAISLLEQQAISLDDANAAAHALLGRMYLSKRRYDESAAEVERAIDLLAPGSAI